MRYVKELIESELDKVRIDIEREEELLKGKNNGNDSTILEMEEYENQLKRTLNLIEDK